MRLNLAFFSLRIIKQGVDQSRRLTEMSGLAIAELPYHDGGRSDPWPRPPGLTGFRDESRRKYRLNQR